LLVVPHKDVHVAGQHSLRRFYVLAISVADARQCKHRRSDDNTKADLVDTNDKHRNGGLQRREVEEVLIAGSGAGFTSDIRVSVSEYRWDT